MFRLRGLDSVFFTFHLLFLGLTYTVYLAPHIAPSTLPYLGLIPIAFPILVLCNLLMIFILFWRNWAFALLFLLFSAGLYIPLSKTWQYFGTKTDTVADLKVISFNSSRMDRNDIIEFLKEKNPDIYLGQESHTFTNKFLVKHPEISDYYYENNAGLCFFSKYPIVEFQQILVKNENSSSLAAYADIDTGSDTLRLINVYLSSMLLEKDLIIESTESVDRATENSKILTNKLTHGFLQHEQQLKKILPFIMKSKHPVILCGDFNSVPNSYEYQQIIYFLEDAYYEVGRSAGTTFHDYKYPIRIDYIFHSKEIQPVEFKVLRDVKSSDHYPVMGTFKLP